MTVIHPLVMRARDAHGEIHEHRAINEVSLFRQSAQAAHLRILVDGKERLAELIADGVMVATPAGSTAYNLSAQGPIIPINAPMLALTPISPFRPRRWRGALLPDKAKVTIEVLEADKRPVAAVADHDEVRSVHAVDIAHGSRRLDQHAVRSRPQPRRTHLARAVRVLGFRERGMSTTFSFTVNGRAVSVALDNEETPLLDVLRNELGLIGTRFGCGLEQCGCCMVLVDGEPEKSCAQAGLDRRRQNASPRSRGSARAEQPHPLQQAFLDEQAGQCGYCLSGIIDRGQGAARPQSAPTRAEIAQALDGNICRCGTHNRILRAVEKRGGRACDGGARMNAPALARPRSADNPRLDRWVAFPSPGKVTVSTGRVEIGQGVLTAMAQIAAEELDVSPARIDLRPATPTLTPNEGYTAGSQSIQVGGVALRLACAEVRALFLDACGGTLGSTARRRTRRAATARSLRNGAPTGHDYWTLAGAVDLAAQRDRRRAARKPVADYRIVGTEHGARRPAGKVFGAAGLHPRHAARRHACMRACVRQPQPRRDASARSTRPRSAAPPRAPIEFVRTAISSRSSATTRPRSTRPRRRRRQPCDMGRRRAADPVPGRKRAGCCSARRSTG